jgi:hypothetical protein
MINRPSELQDAQDLTWNGSSPSIRNTKWTAKNSRVIERKEHRRGLRSELLVRR